MTELRRYTDDQIAQFLEDDILDGEALAAAREFDRATGGTFFATDRGAGPADPQAGD